MAGMDTVHFRHGGGWTTRIHPPQKKYKMGGEQIVKTKTKLKKKKTETSIPKKKKHTETSRPKHTHNNHNIHIHIHIHIHTQLKNSRPAGQRPPLCGNGECPVGPAPERTQQESHSVYPTAILNVEIVIKLLLLSVHTYVTNMFKCHVFVSCVCVCVCMCEL